jgi:hypothetical protein
MRVACRIKRGGSFGTAAARGQGSRSEVGKSNCRHRLLCATFVIVPMWVPVCVILAISVLIIRRAGVILPHLSRSEQRGFEVLAIEKPLESQQQV